MKLKKSLLAGATAATLAFAGTGIATAQDGSSELPTGSLTSLSSDGSGEGSSTDGSGEGSSGIDADNILGSLGDDEGILGSLVTEAGDPFQTIKNITAIISLITAAVGLGGLFG
ncbi:hypothetical protein PQI66_06925 [Corynebacterium sp. USCH3]|uniref:hypothetical protein n=1 Tax=Corynebacterium sp. USCH3 TaxID=3024840 RepID=UPI003099E298